MIIGVGVDIVDMDRITNVYQRHGERFLRRVLHDNEMREFRNERALIAYLARQFAAKEAVSKSLGSGMRSGVSFKNIQVLRKSSGEPYVELSGGAAAFAEDKSVDRVLVSLSDERRYAVAYATALSQKQP